MSGTRPGERKAVNIDFISAVAASGIVAAKANTRFNILGFHLTVPSGAIEVNFTDGTADMSGKYIVTKDSPLISYQRLVTGAVNRPIQIKVNAPVSSLLGDIWFEEEEQFTKQTTNLKVVKQGPHPEL